MYLALTIDQKNEKNMNKFTTRQQRKFYYTLILYASLSTINFTSNQVNQPLLT